MAMNATIVQIEYPRDDIAILTITPDDILPYKAGQFLKLSVNDLGVRPYSIANKPGGSSFEIHVKNTGGQSSKFILEDLKEQDRVQVDCVGGDVYYEEDDPSPIVFVAGGLGITPIKAMIEQALACDHITPIRLYWGVSSDSDDYLSPYFKMLASAVECFDVHVQKGGVILHKVLEDFASLEGYKIYLAGSDAMISHAKPELINKGADEAMILYDRYAVPSDKTNEKGRAS
jgi:NAD(P)H-flavin reductase